MKVDIEYIEGQIKATATSDKGNTAAWSEDLGGCIAAVYDEKCIDANFEHENLINAVVYAAQTSVRCAIDLLNDTFKEDIASIQFASIKGAMLKPIAVPTRYSGFYTKGKV